jgi:hypothetical protein
MRDRQNKCRRREQSTARDLVFLRKNLKIVKQFFFLILTVLLLVAPEVLAIDTIKPAEAAQHAGEEVFVEGVVASVHATPKGVAFINFGEAYPNQVFPALFRT